ASRGPVTFHITDGTWRWSVPQLDPENVAWSLDYCHGFLGRIPSAVWRELGQVEPPHLRQVA
ncbi:hypothetical protein N3930_46565, partial [Bacillus thuringiensis]|nr:hypothetical protein [Bacillus thuringiensis]